MNIIRICVFAALSACALPSLSDGLPFWGGDASDTNRTCASSASVKPKTGFDSRVSSADLKHLDFFDSFKIGFLLFLR